MSTIRKWLGIEREDVGDAAIMTAVTTLLLLGLEFLFTTSLLHYISTPIFVIETLAAVAAGALVSLVVIKATDDEDRSSLRVFF